MSRYKHSGFTIIELMLAMAFVSALLVAIALTIIQISGIYNRGITLKEVNQAGRSVSSDLQSSISATTPFNVDPGVGDTYLNSTTTKYAKSNIVAQNWGGALCLGQFSYVWNDGKAISDAFSSGNYTNLNIYSGVNYTGVMPDNKIIKFVKIYDPNGDYCVTDSQNKIKQVNSTLSTDLLNVGQNNLVIHKFTIATPIKSDSMDLSVVTTSQQLYDITFIIGTNNRESLNLDSDGVATSCQPPSVLTSDPTYCSIEQFHFVSRAGNTN